jgi:GTPase SAR1 family protein
MASVKTVEQKVILVGDFGVGKSSLFRRYMCDTFINSSDRKATLGMRIKFLSQLLRINVFE